MFSILKLLSAGAKLIVSTARAHPSFSVAMGIAIPCIVFIGRYITNRNTPRERLEFDVRQPIAEEPLENDIDPISQEPIPTRHKIVLGDSPECYDARYLLLAILSQNNPEKNPLFNVLIFTHPITQKQMTQKDIFDVCQHFAINERNFYDLWDLADEAAKSHFAGKPAREADLTNLDPTGDVKRQLRTESALEMIHNPEFVNDLKEIYSPACAQRQE